MLAWLLAYPDQSVSNLFGLHEIHIYKLLTLNLCSTSTRRHLRVNKANMQEHLEHSAIANRTYLQN